jgi:1,4-dihydroxy-2-naphthoyl-CoA synthase
LHRAADDGGFGTGHERRIVGQQESCHEWLCCGASSRVSVRSALLVDT